MQGFDTKVFLTRLRSFATTPSWAVTASAASRRCAAVPSLRAGAPESSNPGRGPSETPPAPERTSTSASSRAALEYTGRLPVFDPQ